jgi:hypothetical protein
MTSSENPYFARAIANRLWAHFFSRGIVQPVDDLREENAPFNPELLQALAAEFSASGFDIKHLIRCICLSEPYGRTSRPLPENQKDEALFSHVAVKVMTAEVLYDSLHAVVNAQPFGGPPVGGGKKPSGPQSITLEPRDSFVRFFARSAEVDKGEQYSYGIPHMLRLMNGRELNVSPGFLSRIPEGKAADDVVETIYLVVLSRRPSSEETSRMTELIGERRGTEEVVQAYGDVLWVLLNSSEFVLNR